MWGAKVSLSRDEPHYRGAQGFVRTYLNVKLSQPSPDFDYDLRIGRDEQRR